MAKARLHGLRQIEGEIAEIRVGLQTGDDKRFLRNYWEVDADKVSLDKPNDYYLALLEFEWNDCVECPA